MAGTSAAAKKRKTKDDKKRDNHCLPDDMHFSSRQLVTLFLKPKFSVRVFVFSCMLYVVRKIYVVDRSFLMSAQDARSTWASTDK